MKWTSRHEDFEQGRSFSDVMVSGPMRSWRHYREFSDEGSGTMLRETVTYEFPVLSHLPRPSPSNCTGCSRTNSYAYSISELGKPPRTWPFTRPTAP